MKGSEIAAALQELGVDKDNHRVLGLLPLVYVAWADGKVQCAEKSTILAVAKEKGWLAGGGERILDGWLREAPTSEYVDKGLRVLGALAQEQRSRPGSVQLHTLQHLVAYCRDVAAAAGGAFGLEDPISSVEQDALVTIARAFGIEGGKTWQQIARDADDRSPRLPPGPKGAPFVGNLIEFMGDPLGFLQKSVNEHGDVISLRVPGETMIVVTRPEHIDHVLVNGKDNYVRGKEYDDLALATGKSLLTTEGEVWRRARRISQPAFNHKSLAPMAERIVAQTDAMLERWRGLAASGKPVDIAAEMMAVTLSVIGWLMFSTEIGDTSSAVGEAVGVALRHVQGLINNPIRLPNSFPTPENRRFRKAIRVFDDLVYALIAERRKQAAEERPNDLLSLVMAAKDEETGEGLDDQQLRNEILSFLIAGHETTAGALTWALYLMSKHPIEARKVRAEIADVVGREKPSVELAKKLRYTMMAVDENMRLYPSAPIFARRAVAEDEIGGYRIPAGVNVLVSPWVTHRRPDIWPNPEGFDPERFSEEASRSRPRSAYFPFGAGPHKCIGYPLAMMELSLMFPMILRAYRVDLVAGFEPGIEAAITLRPARGMMMTLHAP